MTEQNQEERRTDLPASETAGENGQENMDIDSRQSAVSAYRHEEESSAELNGENGDLMAQFGAVYNDDYGVDDEAVYREETAAEIAPPINQEKRNEVRSPLKGEEVGYREQLEGIESIEEQRDAEEGSTALGWTALVLSLVSLFFLPVLTASAGIVTGFFAYRGGSRTLGLWAIGVGLFSLVMAFFISPFLTRF